MGFARAGMGFLIGHIMMVMWFRLLSSSLGRALQDPPRAAGHIITTCIARASLIAIFASVTIYALGFPGGLGLCISIARFQRRLMARGLGAL